MSLLSVRLFRTVAVVVQPVAMKNLSRLVLVLAVCALSLGAFAQSVAGKWKGKIDMSAVKATTDTQKQQLQMMKQAFEKCYFNLEMKGDKTYAIEMGGFPGQKPTNEKGKWSQSGRTITVKGKKDTQKMTVSADGKTMTMVPPAQQGMPKGLKIVFKRG